jgi:hypothetical protein
MTLPEALAGMPRNGRVFRSSWPTIRLRYDYTGLYLVSGEIWPDGTTHPYALSRYDLTASDWRYAYDISNEEEAVYG